MKKNIAWMMLMVLAVSSTSEVLAITPQEIADQKVDFAYTIQEFVSVYATKGQAELEPAYPALQALQQLVYLTPLQLSSSLRLGIQTYLRMSETRLETLLEHLITLSLVRQRVVHDMQSSDEQRGQLSASLDNIEGFLLAEIEDRLLRLSPTEAARLKAYFTARAEENEENKEEVNSGDVVVSGSGENENTTTPES